MKIYQSLNDSKRLIKFILRILDKYIYYVLISKKIKNEIILNS
jgi:hypothetical protein